MKYTILFLAIGLILFFIPINNTRPSFNGTDPGCSGGGCHTFQDGMVSVSINGLQVQVTVTGTSGAVAGELVDGSGTVVTYNNGTNSNPFTLIATDPGNYTVNAGHASPLRWDSASVSIDPVPVELVSFVANVNANTVTLSWQTATETNNSGFDIQRKKLNKDWENVGFVEGHGTTTNESYYTFTDRNVLSGNYSYRLTQIDFDGTRNESEIVSVEVSSQPTEYSLSQNYPNPFNPSTMIKYTIPEASYTALKVYDELGKEVALLVNETKSAGTYEVEFNALKLSSGIYYYTLQAGTFTETKKMLLIK